VLAPFPAPAMLVYMLVTNTSLSQVLRRFSHQKKWQGSFRHFILATGQPINRATSLIGNLRDVSSKFLNLHTFAHSGQIISGSAGNKKKAKAN
jgi:hypothetical protein